jgi:hypothetical protein
MMIIKVHMTAFGEPGEIREVTIPDTVTENILEVVFEYGQNENQPQRHPSVSIADVIEFEGYHIVAWNGFTSITSEQFEEWLKIPRRERAFHIWSTGGQKVWKVQRSGQIIQDGFATSQEAYDWLDQQLLAGNLSGNYVVE